MSRRSVLRAALAALGIREMTSRASAFGASPDLQLSGDAAEAKLDFEAGGIDGWTTVAGQWVVEEMAGAPSGKRVLMQRATKNEFNVIVAPPGPFSDVDVSVKFKPIAGREDASGGIVFRFAEGKYYLIRANALEDNFRFYYYERDRRMLSSASVRAPALKQWHTVRAVATGERIQGWLDGALLLDYRDARFRAGRVGLWTKADSITAFDEFTVRGVAAT